MLLDFGSVVLLNVEWSVDVLLVVVVDSSVEEKSSPEVLIFISVDVLVSLVLWNKGSVVAAAFVIVSTAVPVEICEDRGLGSVDLVVDDKGTSVLLLDDWDAGVLVFVDNCVVVDSVWSIVSFSEKYKQKFYLHIWLRQSIIKIIKITKGQTKG